jgi:drug/metabolite transporter (DMT)-like permease
VSRRGWFLFLALCLIWGMPYLMVRVAVRELAPETLVFVRSLLAGVVLVPFALRRGGLRDIFALWPWLLLFTLLEMSLPWFLIADAEQHISSSLAGLLVGAMPLIGVVLYRWMGEPYHFDVRHVTGLACGFGGLAALVGVDVGSSDISGVLQMLAVCLCWAVAPVIVVKRLPGLPALGMAATTLVINAIGFAPFAALNRPSSVSAETVVAVVVLAVLCTALAFLIYFALIREVGASRSAVITYVNPLVAVILGVLVLSEPVTLGILVGTPLILIGSLLATAPSRRTGADGATAEALGEAEPGP